MFTFDHWPDNEPRFPDRLAISAPRGTREALRRRAAAEHTTVPALLRRLIADVIGPAPQPDAHR